MDRSGISTLLDCRTVRVQPGPCTKRSCADKEQKARETQRSGVGSDPNRVFSLLLSGGGRVPLPPTLSCVDPSPRLASHSLRPLSRRGRASGPPYPGVLRGLKICMSTNARTRHHARHETDTRAQRRKHTHESNTHESTLKALHVHVHVHEHEHDT